MAKWDFKIVGASFVKETVGADVKFRSESFMQPSFDLEGGKIVMKESGAYKTAIYFSQIGEIAGVAPTDIDDAYAKLLALVENFNGGGATSQDLDQTLAIGNTSDRTINLINGNSLTVIEPSVVVVQDTITTKGAGISAQGVDVFTGSAITGVGIKSDNTTEPYIAQFPNKTGGADEVFAMLSDIATSAWGSITGTLSAQTDLQTALNAKENITVARTGSVIAFDDRAVYNSIASPSSSNITDNLTAARIGVIQKIYHNAGTAPTFPAGWVRRGTATYATSTLNIIYAEWSVGTTVEYWITQ